MEYRDKQQTIIGGHEVYQGNKPVLTLKELDFRVRQTLIKNKSYITMDLIKGKLT